MCFRYEKLDAEYGKCYGIIVCGSTGSWQLEIKEKQIKEQEK